MLSPLVILAFLFSIVIAYGALFLVIHRQIKIRKIDSGYLWFFVPLIPSVLLIFLECIRRIFLLLGLIHLAAVIVIGASFLRLVCGWSWLYFSERHYALNRLPLSIRIYSRGTALSISVNILILALSYVLPEFQDILGSISSLILNVALFLAAFFALLALKYKNELLPSTWAGISAALVSLVAYPCIIITEVFGFSYDFLDTAWPVWIQVHPYYALLILITLAIFIMVSMNRTKETEYSEETALSERERAVAVLLIEERSNKEIADILCISLATVKTHISRIYKKEGVFTRQEYIEKKKVGT